MSPYVRDDTLSGRSILVIGGTSGFGFGVVTAILAHPSADITIHIASSRQESLHKTKTRLHEMFPSAGARIKLHKIDLTSSKLESDLKHLLENCTDNGAVPLDHIVFTAGDHVPFHGVKDITQDMITDSQKTRLVAPLLTASILDANPDKYMSISRSSSIILTGGIRALKPDANWPLFTVVLSAIEGAARSLAMSLTPIRVNCVAPGAVWTEMFEKYFNSHLELESVKQYLESKILFGTMGEPDEVAEAYIYLMKDRFVTGQTIRSDGGMLIRE